MNYHLLYNTVRSICLGGASRIFIVRPSKFVTCQNYEDKPAYGANSRSLHNANSLTLHIWRQLKKLKHSLVPTFSLVLSFRFARPLVTDLSIIATLHLNPARLLTIKNPLRSVGHLLGVLSDPLTNQNIFELSRRQHNKYTS